MSTTTKYVPALPGIQPMVLFNTSSNYEMAVMLSFGFQMTQNQDGSVSIKMGTPGGSYEYTSVKGPASKMTPEGDMSLIDKLRLRFKAAAENGTDVDLRFCTGNEKVQKPEYDNLRQDYSATPKF